MQGNPPAADTFQYQPGFANHFSSEALPGALPAQNSPRLPLRSLRC